jgi:hypothetical protein
VEKIPEMENIVGEKGTFKVNEKTLAESQRTALEGFGGSH